MTTVRTFVSHASLDKPRVNAILRKAAPYGVRPWIDEHDLQGEAGGSLRDHIFGGIRDPSCRSMALFLSEASVKSEWVQNEAGEALTLLPDGWRIIPIALDPIGSLNLPPVIETVLRKHPSGHDTLYLEASHPQFLQRFASAVLRASGIDKSEDVVLHLGHRDRAWEPNIPEAWKDRAAIDLRLSYPVGHKEFSPTEDEWKEIHEGLDFIGSRLNRVTRLGICGFAPLGVAVAVGRSWDRGTGVTLEAWNPKTGQIWTSANPGPVEGWEPAKGRHLSVHSEGNLFSGASTLAVAFLNHDHYKADVQRWNGSRTPVPPLLLVKTPEKITDAAQATEVLSECIGVFAWIRRTYPQFTKIDLVLTLPMPTAAFLSHHLRQFGEIHYYDAVSAPGGTTYRLAISW